MGVSALLTGVVWGALGAKLGGTRRTAYLTPLIGLAAGLGAYTAYDWWWVTLLAVTGVIAGAGFRYGWFAPLLMAPYAATFVTPTSTWTAAVTFGAIGAGYGIVIMHRFGAPPVVEGERYPLPATIAIVVAIIAPPSWALTVLAIVAMLLAVMLRATYWQMYGPYTFALVLYLATPGDVAFEAEERGLQILAGIALLIVGLAILNSVGQVLARRYPQPELAVAAPRP